MATPFYDEERAINVLSAFSFTSNLGVALYTPSEKSGVEIRFAERSCQALCEICKNEESGDWPQECKMVHRLASIFADNAGTSYLYICPEDYMFFASPIVEDNRLVAAATVGPIVIGDEEDADPNSSGPLLVDEDGVPVREGEYLQKIATVLSAAVASCGAHVHAVTVKVAEGENGYEKPIDAPLLGLKSAHVKEYPIEFETDLIVAIREANAAQARHALIEILGYLLSSSLVDSRYRFRERIDELVSVASHAALRAGVSTEEVFPVIERCRGELRFMSSEDQMCSRVHHFVEQIIALVQNLYDVEFDDFKYRAISYLHENYRHRVTLDEAAEALGFSPSYFSRSFKEHMGCTFVTYLNEVRIQAAKSELISTDRDIAAIAEAVGFESVSYFIRVFKREVGLTPGGYRSHRGQIIEAGAEGVDEFSARNIAFS